MLTIKGDITEIKRDIIEKPLNDSIHRYNARGKLKGGHCVYIGNKFCPYGNASFYWKINNSYGIKVYYSFAWDGIKEKEYIRRIKSKLKFYAKLGLAPAPLQIVRVKLNFVFKKRKLKVNRKCWGLITEHIDWSSGWQDYCNGQHYDWDCVDHEKHSPEGFKEFAKKLKKHKRKKDVIDGYKLGDTIWCCGKNKWLICDVR